MMLKEGDVLFRRAANGWVVSHIRSSDTEGVSLHEEIFVYEDQSVEVPASDSLLSALRDTFDGYFQTKWTGGIKAEIRGQGREQENLADIEAQMARDSEGG
jgi:hypothetical protein